MKDPAFLFYSSDFMTGVSDLTMEERGQYITMLCLQHQKGRISPKTIRLTIGLASVDVLSKFEIDTNGDYYNPRLDEEIEKRSQFVDSRRVNGSKGGRPKVENKPLGKANAKPLGKAKNNLSEDVNDNEDIDVIKEEIIEKSEIEKTLDEFYEMRKKLRKPPTEKAKELILKELTKLAGNDDVKKIAIVNQSIVNGYTDVYPLKTKTVSINGGLSQDPKIAGIPLSEFEKLKNITL